MPNPDVNSMLNSAISGAVRAAQMYGGGGNRSAGREDDPIAKENRTAMRALLKGAATSNNPDEIRALEQQARALGIDPSPYASLAGIQTPEEQAQSQVNTTLSNAILQLFGGQTQQQGPIAQPQMQQAQTQEYTPPPMEQPAPPAPAPEQAQTQNIFTQDFLLRSAMKKFAGIDVGAHYFEAPQWFESYGQRVKSGIPVEQAVSETAVEYGFIPDGASNLDGISDTDRTVLFEREFSAALNDPTLDAVLQRIIPKGTNAQKAKAGYVLEAFASQGRYIPEHYQPFLDRFRGLEEPDFVSNDLKTYAYQNTGKLPSELTPNDIVFARKAMQDDAIIQTARGAAAGEIARTEAQYSMEAAKPVSAEDRAKYGIGAQFESYQQLADAGKRFPTETDRKVYQELLDMRDEIATLENILFDMKNGIFTGIGDNVGARTAAKGRLSWEKAKGTDRGRNVEFYDDLLASYARRLLTLSGESGGRFTDRDVAQISRALMDTGRGLLGVPDSEKNARRKFDRALYLFGTKLDELRNTTVIAPIGQPNVLDAPTVTLDPDAEADALIKQEQQRRRGL